MRCGARWWNPRAGWIVTMALVVGVLGGCAGDSEAERGGPAALVEALPEDGELGAPWLRLGEPRVGAAAEASTICGVRLGVGMIDGAKIDLANDRDDLVSTFFRRYADDASALSAFRQAETAIARCPADGVSPDVPVRIVPVVTPDTTPDTYAALLTPAAVGVSDGEFGWAVVRTGDVVRSLQFAPARARTSTADELRELAVAIGATR